MKQSQILKNEIIIKIQSNESKITIHEKTIKSIQSDNEKLLLKNLWGDN